MENEFNTMTVEDYVAVFEEAIENGDYAEAKRIMVDAINNENININDEEDFYESVDEFGQYDVENIKEELKEEIITDSHDYDADSNANEGITQEDIEKAINSNNEYDER